MIDPSDPLNIVPEKINVDPETGWELRMVAEMANSIKVADSANRNAWAVHLWEGEPLLAVGKINVISVGPSTPFGYMIMNEALSREQSEWVNQFRTERIYSNFPWAVYLWIPPDAVERTIELLHSSHVAAVRKIAARVSRRSGRATSHRQNYLERIAGLSGIRLPAPGYLLGTASTGNRGNTTESATGLEGMKRPSSAPLSLLSDSFASEGYTYTVDQIATFYTALQTKGFVVLSGISGTGKSKIAQGFVNLLPSAEAVPLTVQPGFSSNGGLTIPKKFASRLGFPRENASGSIFISLSSARSEGLVRVRNNYGENLFTEIRPKDSTRNHILGLKPGTTLYVRFSEWQDGLPTRVVLDDKAPSNSLFLAVRPDWRDSTSLLGYYNPLTETYEWTEFLRFLLQAVKDFDANGKDALAWFVILDEMNLAHVEYYFADLLSIIESGRDEDGWSREPIRLTYPDAKTDNPPPHEIYLPPNLYIIGTVNMDETTHAFSPKVLDRAFTIELTDVDFRDYPPAPTDGDHEISDAERQELLRQFTREGVFAQVSKDDVRKAVDAHEELSDWLQNLNTRLTQHQFQFGYRVFDEIAQFIHNADENGMFDSWETAFDHAVFMKVLPKFNGSHARLHGPLTTTLQWANDPSRKVSVPVGGETGDDQPEIAAPRLDRVATRVQRMLDTLEANGFVSFG